MIRTRMMVLFSLVVLGICRSGVGAEEKVEAVDLATWRASPEHFGGAVVEKGRVALDSAKWKAAEKQPGRWAYWAGTKEFADVSVRATVTVRQKAKQFAYFGQSWTVWPDPTYGDGGFEVGMLLRAGESKAFPSGFGYRVQLSHQYQCMTLVKYPNGGYLRVVPTEVKVNQAYTLETMVQGDEIVVKLDGKEKVRVSDTLVPLTGGRVGLGVSSGAVVTFDEVTVQALPVGKPGKAALHKPDLRTRKWLGERDWVFDGDEPILMLPTADSSYINSVKLRPGYKPQLSWNSHWDIQNQGAFPEGTNKMRGGVETKGGGDTLTAKWAFRQIKDRFETRTTLTVGWDAERNVYTYDVDSELEVLAGEPFHFRYGYDFEHHTPLDPFNWQYLVVRREGEQLSRRPVYPIDPGPMYGVEQYHGMRMWFGRHNEEMQIAPTVEYQIDPEWNRDPEDAKKAKVRKLNTAVCAAFYDTGVSFEQETAKPGTKVRVKYRYTGYPAQSAKELFDASKVYATPTLDEKHHWIFADEWPKLTFSKHVPLSETWIYGRTPFRGNTANSVRPSYYLAEKTGVGSGHALRLGSLGLAEANWPIPAPLPAGKYMLKALCKADNTHGAGGRIELKVQFADKKREALQLKHFVGNGSFAWKTVGFALDLPAEATALHLTLANGGTGDLFLTDVEFTPATDVLPQGVTASANGKAPELPVSLPGTVADYRMVEGKGKHVLDFARGPFGLLELSNLDWVTDEGRSALRFSDNTTNRKDFARDGTLERSYLNHPGYKDRDVIPLAIAGTHGGSCDLTRFTVGTWIKPAVEMGKSTHGGKGDILGLGARRFILSLNGQKAPYTLQARLNVNDVFSTETQIEADKWYHVAMTCEPTKEKQWQVKLYLDGKCIHTGVTQKFDAPTAIPPSLILGSEIFYFHDAYYRGLIGRTMILDRVLSEEEIAGLMK